MLRLKKHEIPFEGPSVRFDEKVVSLADYDGLKLELVGNSADMRKPWEKGPVPPEMAIRGFYSVTLSEEGYERTAWLLENTFRFKSTMHENNRFRYEAQESGPGGIVDILCTPDTPSGYVSVGTTHHVAWRTSDDEQQKQWREEIVSAGLKVTPVIDRKYFHSIYFREPGGVLFEIATDPPGFTIDQAREELGMRLMLPAWLEPLKEKLEQELPPVHLPPIESRSVKVR
jgi:glyoxalase family protein